MSVMPLRAHVPLASFTTFGIGGTAEYFADVSTISELSETLKEADKQELPVTVLGGGSNVLIDDDGVPGILIRLALSGVEWRDAEDDSDSVICTVAAGENWDQVVTGAVEQKLWGIENLSGIPGSCGAAPIQNIGAYGAELSDVCEWVEAVERATGEVRRFAPAECNFRYRWSFFKSPEGKNWIVTRVALRLSKTPRPSLEYRDLAAYFQEYSHTPSLSEIRQAVLSVRAQKFPDLSELGTAGSFFTNPIVSREKREELLEQYPDLPHFDVDERRVKISAAWILDNVCGLKGYRRGPARLFERQPLVIVAEAGARAVDIRTLAEEVTERVRYKTGIELQREVRYLPEERGEG